MPRLQFRALPAGDPDPGTVPPRLVRRVVADAEPGYPCRRCLRFAAVGDPLWLLTYDPFLGDSPYRQPGPIFVHVRPCHPDPGDVLGAVPPMLPPRSTLSVRAFGPDHLMTTAEVHDGAHLAEAAHRLLAESSVSYLHVHYAGPGCFAVRVELV